VGRSLLIQALLGRFERLERAVLLCPLFPGFLPLECELRLQRFHFLAQICLNLLLELLLLERFLCFDGHER
jgi:hypothetical protein